MKLTILGSNSSGNCYVLHNSYTALIIEAGIDLLEVKKLLNFDISKIQGCIVSHEHIDHAKHIDNYVKSGINVYVSEGTKDILQNKNLKTLNKNKDNKIGDFVIIPFKAIHDAKEPIGFLIYHDDIKPILFLTDSKYLLYNFHQHFGTIIIEANFDNNILIEKYLSGKINNSVRLRIMENHLSIQNCIDAIKRNITDKTENIVLIHLSDGNSNAKEFKQNIIKTFGINCTVGDKNININLTNNF